MVYNTHHEPKTENHHHQNRGPNRNRQHRRHTVTVVDHHAHKRLFRTRSVSCGLGCLVLLVAMLVSGSAIAAAVKFLM